MKTLFGLIIAVASLFGQATTFTNPYDLRTNSPQADALVMFTTSLGAPAPTRLDEVLAYPGGSYTFSSLTFSKPPLEDFKVSLALGVAGPGVLANDLASHGFVVLDVPVPAGLTVAGVNVPPAPPPAPVVLPPSISSPIGNQFTPLPATSGSRFFSNPRDTSKDGAVWVDGSGRYTKHVIPGPFGNSVYWERN